MAQQRPKKKKRCSENNVIAPKYVKILELHCEETRPVFMKTLNVLYAKLGGENREPDGLFSRLGKTGDATLREDRGPF